MTGYHVRTENGVPALLPSKEALAEVDLVMMDKAAKRSTKAVSAARSAANIEYRDGRKVAIRPATPEDITALTPLTVTPAEVAKNVRIPRAPEGSRIVAAKGKQYVVTTVLRGSVDYWTFRNGRAYGSTREASESDKPGTVGAAVWVAVNS